MALVVAVQVLLTVVLALATVAVSARAGVVKGRVLIFVLVGAVAAAVVVGVWAGGGYPWSNLFVLAIAWSAGTLFARSGAPWFWGVLSLLAVLDLGSFVVGGQGASSPGSSGPAALINVTVIWATGHFRLGLFDLAVLTALTVRWLRAWPVVCATVFTCVSSLIPFFVLLVGVRGGIPLLPVLALSGVGVAALGGAFGRRESTSVAD